MVSVSLFCSILAVSSSSWTWVMTELVSSSILGADVEESVEIPRLCARGLSSGVRISNVCLWMSVSEGLCWLWGADMVSPSWGCDVKRISTFWSTRRGRSVVSWRSSVAVAECWERSDNKNQVKPAKKQEAIKNMEVNKKNAIMRCEYMNHLRIIKGHTVVREYRTPSNCATNISLTE